MPDPAHCQQAAACLQTGPLLVPYWPAQGMLFLTPVARNGQDWRALLVFGPRPGASDNSQLQSPIRLNPSAGLWSPLSARHQTFPGYPSPVPLTAGKDASAAETSSAASKTVFLMAVSVAKVESPASVPFRASCVQRIIRTLLYGRKLLAGR